MASSSQSFTSSQAAGWIDSGYLGDVSLTAGNHYAFLTGVVCSSGDVTYYYASATATDLGTSGEYFTDSGSNTWAGDWTDVQYMTYGYHYNIDVSYN